MKDQTTFHRFEEKYLLSPFSYQRLRQSLDTIMEEDACGCYTVNNLYFDTDNYDIIHTSALKPALREKLRLRWYSRTDTASDISREIKYKYRSRVYKRRSLLKPSGTDRLLEHNGTPGRGHSAKEVDCTFKPYHPTPKLLLAYDRETLKSSQETGLRITFDRNIRWRDHDFKMSSGSYGTPLMPEDTVFMEIKAYGDLPIWLTEILTAENIYPASFSKYASGMQPCIFA